MVAGCRSASPGGVLRAAGARFTIEEMLLAYGTGRRGTVYDAGLIAPEGMMHQDHDGACRPGETAGADAAHLRPSGRPMQARRHGKARTP